MIEAHLSPISQRNVRPHLAGSRPSGAARHERLLVVHSYRSLREAIAQTLRHHGYEVLESAGAADAALLVGEREPGLVLMELAAGSESHGADAAAVASAAREVGVPVVGLASHPLDEGEIEQLGAGEILVMPVEQRGLLAAVERLLEPAGGLMGRGTVDDDPQWRLALEDRLEAEHLTLSFTYPDATRIPLTPANACRVRTFASRLTAMGIEPELRIEGADLLFRYEVTIADAFLLEDEEAEERLHDRLVAAFPQLRKRTDALRERLGSLSAELRQLQRIAS